MKVTVLLGSQILATLCSANVRSDILDRMLGHRETLRRFLFNGPRWRVAAPRSIQRVFLRTLAQARKRTPEDKLEDKCSKLAPLSHSKRSVNRLAAAS